MELLNARRQSQIGASQLQRKSSIPISNSTVTNSCLATWMSFTIRNCLHFLSLSLFFFLLCFPLAIDLRQETLSKGFDSDIYQLSSRFFSHCCTHTGPSFFLSFLSFRFGRGNLVPRASKEFIGSRGRVGLKIDIYTAANTWNGCFPGEIPNEDYVRCSTILFFFLFLFDDTLFCLSFRARTYRR